MDINASMVKSLLVEMASVSTTETYQYLSLSAEGNLQLVWRWQDGEELKSFSVILSDNELTGENVSRVVSEAGIAIDNKG